MSTTASHQIEEIHAMLASGHRSIRMERHSLIIWGIAAAFLILTTESIFTPEHFSIFWQMVTAMNLYISTVLFAAGVVDLRMTRRCRQARSESISFVQRQLTKVWWLFIGLIVVINIGMNFFGGGFLFYGICIILLGLALYIHGLFSQQMLSWGGIMLILIGLSSMAFLPSYEAQKYLAVSVFGLGLPLLSLMIDRVGDSPLSFRKWLFSSIWLIVVLATALLASYWFEPRLSNEELNRTPILSLAEYKQLDKHETASLKTINLPAGSILPFNFSLTSELWDDHMPIETSFRLTREVQLVVNDGVIVGYYQKGGDIKNLRVKQLIVKPVLSQNEGVHIGVDMNFALFKQ